jgi:preprotein translocase subunit SecF
MMQFFGETRIDFIKLRWKAIAVSTIIILAGIVSMIIKGGPKYGVDFLGGTVIQVHFPQAPNIGDVRKAMTDIGYGETEIKTFGEPNEILLRVEAQNVEMEATAIAAPIIKALGEAFPQNPPEQRLVESVGPKIGKELRTAAIWATLISLALILIYVSFRFEFIFAVGAVVALFHDVMVTVGVLSVLNMEINLTVVAALLTIVGFSLNDTIVVMDRIRENRRLLRDANIEQLINVSINQTLGRTIIHHFVDGLDRRARFAVFRRRGDLQFCFRHDRRCDFRRLFDGLHRRAHCRGMVQKDRDPKNPARRQGRLGGAAVLST